MDDNRNRTKKYRELSIDPYTAALLRTAERLGWYVERGYDNRGMDVLKIGRSDILCGPEDRDAGLFRHPYSVTIPVADQGSLVEIVCYNAQHFCVNGFANEAFPDSDEIYDFAGMERDAELLQAAMKDFCAVLRQLRNTPEFLLESNARIRMSMLEDEVNDFGVYKSDEWYFYDTGKLGRCVVSRCFLSDTDTIDDTLDGIDGMLQDVEYHLDSFKDTFQGHMTRKLGFEDDFTDILQNAHRAEEEWKTWADVCERENHIRVMGADEMTLEDEIVAIGGKQDG